jgi:gamma-glutamylcyclotransferase (GGCT)/AIG2-like uncharacterized protein YtfP
MSKTDFFFVYGTLKVGGHFAKDFDPFRIHSNKANLLGHDLYNLGWFPGIVPGPGKVIGELHEYKNPDIVQRAMDRIEGYTGDPANSLFVRKLVTVTVNETGEKVTCNAYVFNRDPSGNAKKIDNGVWELSGTRA